MSNNTLPVSVLPDCWDDDARITVLFAPFRSRTVNPKDWDDKLSFWRKLISSYCNATKTFSFKLTDLMHVFVKNGRPPSCLPVVIDEMCKMGDLKTVDQFTTWHPQSWKSWASNVIMQPITWPYSKFKSFLMPQEKETTFIHLPSVREYSETFRKFVIEKYKATILDLNELQEYTKEMNIDLSNLELLLKYLEKENYVAMKEFSQSSSHNVLIKFNDSNKKKISISDAEVDIYTLQKTEKILTNDIAKLESEVSTVIEKVKSYLRKGHRQTVSKKRHLFVGIVIVVKSNKSYSNVETMEIKQSQALFGLKFIIPKLVLLV